jgi:UDP-N-acetyl-D-mannosaminuronic acid dehydrogenase
MTRRKVAVVGGCGHVGLPLSIALAEHHDVLIYDIDVEAAERIGRGELPFKDEGAVEGLAAALARGMRVSTIPDGLPECDAVVFVIGTPVDEHLNPSFTLFDTVLDELFEWLRDGQTLVLRSTVLPGTSERVVRMLERHGLAVEVAFCPERVAEGHALEEIRTLPQIVSGFSPRGVAAARELFEPLGVELIELTPLEAELAKLFTNTYRYITFAVANQFYMVACDYGLDFYKILHAVTHNYPRGADMPSAGFAAGPCLFKDTMQMLSFNDNQFFLGHSAMLVNEGLPKFVVNRMKKRWPDLDKKTIGLLGMAFKAESDDTRESLSYKLKKILQINSRAVLTCDPEVRDETLSSEEDVLARADIFVIGAPHRRYRSLDYRGKPVVDVWNLLGQGGAI